MNAQGAGMWVLLIAVTLVLGGRAIETTGAIREPALPADRVGAQLDLARSYLEALDYTRALQDLCPDSPEVKQCGVPE